VKVGFHARPICTDRPAPRRDRRRFRLGEKDDQQNDDDDEQYSAAYVHASSLLAIASTMRTLPVGALWRAILHVMSEADHPSGLPRWSPANERQLTRHFAAAPCMPGRPRFP
jgi:hypothetical protein